MKPKKLLLPATKGKMGIREYISCSMPITELCPRVSLAHELSMPNLPSEKIQREVIEKRITGILEYLNQKDHFFNSIVVAVCGGDPVWHSFKQLHGFDDIKDEERDKLGFISFTGEEKMYALDGQHRLLGLKEYIKMHPDTNDAVNVLFVVHDENTQSGVKASRRLFTVLNKHAHEVSKRDIIYLDEDDAMAIVVRHLIEHNPKFKLVEKIYPSSTNQFPSGLKTSCFTTVGILYDSLARMFNLFVQDHNVLKEIKNKRVEDNIIEMLLSKSVEFFLLLEDHILAFREYYQGNSIDVINKYRSGKNSDHLLFRPQGFYRVVKLACDLYAKEHKNQMYDSGKMAEIVRKISALPMNFDDRPLRGLVWDSKNKKIKAAGFSLLFQIFEYKLSNIDDSNKLQKLTQKYRKEAGGNLASFLSE